MSSLTSTPVATPVVYHITDRDTHWSELLRVRDQFVASLHLISPISVEQIEATISRSAPPMETGNRFVVGGVQ